MNAGIFGNFASVGFGGWTGGKMRSYSSCQPSRFMNHKLMILLHTLTVGFVAAGVWIKTSRQFDPPKAPANYIPLSSVSEDDNREKDTPSSLASSTTSSQLPLYDPSSTGSDADEGAKQVVQTRSKKAILAQYGIPLLCPLVFAGIASLFI